MWYNESLDINQTDGVSDAEREVLVSRTMARVEVLRCLEFTQSVPVRTISRKQFVKQRADQQVPAVLRTFDNAKFEALFLVNESTNSIAVQNQNRQTDAVAPVLEYLLKDLWDEQAGTFASGRDATTYTVTPRHAGDITGGLNAANAVLGLDGVKERFATHFDNTFNRGRLQRATR